MFYATGERRAAGRFDLLDELALDPAGRGELLRLGADGGGVAKVAAGVFVEEFRVGAAGPGGGEVDGVVAPGEGEGGGEW